MANKGYKPEAFKAELKDLCVQARGKFVQENLAGDVDMSPSDFSRKLNGQRPWTQTQVKRLAETLNATDNQLERLLELAGLEANLAQAKQSKGVAAHLPFFDETLYYELHLSERDRDLDKDREGAPQELRHLYHNTQSFGFWQRPKPESHIIKTIRYQKGVQVVLGEPGAGKTTLFIRWSHRLHQAYSEEKGEPFPLYVRLRELEDIPYATFDAEGLQAYFKSRRFGSLDISPFEAGQRPVVWLLDGWDELSGKSKTWWQTYIRNLPGVVIVSCRLAMYRHEFQSQPRLIYGLDREQQEDYLYKLLPYFKSTFTAHAKVDGAWVTELLAEIHGLPQANLRHLATSPLLLRLLAEANPPGQIKVPRSRSEFYDRAVNAILQREMRLGELEIRDRRYLKNVLASIAQEAELRFNFDETTFAAGLEKTNAESGTETKLLKSGLIREVGKNRYEFLHATFQEWSLAQALQEEGLKPAVQKHWRKPNWEETLALLWGARKTADEERFRVTHFLVDQGCCSALDEEWIEQPERMRSGLRVALHLWHGSGQHLDDKSLDLLKPLVIESATPFRLRPLAVAVDRQTPSEVLEILSQDANSKVRVRVASNTNSSAPVLEVLAADKDSNVRSAVTGNPNTPAQVFKTLIADEGLVLFRAVRNRNFPSDLLVELANHEDIETRIAVAGHKNTSKNVLSILANDKEARVRSAVAGNANTDKELLILLANDKDKTVRGSVAKNRNASTDLLTKLANDSDKYVRERVAWTRHTPMTLLEQLCGDEDSGVRLHVAENVNVPKALLIKLAEDEDKMVRFTVARNSTLSSKAVLLKLASDVESDVRFGATLNSNTSVQVLTSLAKDKAISVRGGVAQSSYAPVELLAALVNDEDSGVRGNLARNGNTPPWVLEILATDNSSKVRWFVAQHGSTPTYAIRKLVSDENYEVRQSVASSIRLNKESVETLAKDEDPSVRSFLANNTEICLEIL